MMFKAMGKFANENIKKSSVITTKRIRYHPPFSQSMEKVGESTALNSLAGLATQIPKPLVPHPWAAPEALPLVTHSTPVLGPSADRKIRRPTRWRKPPDRYVML